MQKLISCLLILIATYSFAQPPAIKAMTYNIRNSNAADGANKWPKRKQALTKLITKANPDILGTQEALIDQLKDLKKLLPAYAEYGAGRNNGKHAGEHSAIFYKGDKYKLLQAGNFWLSETPGKPGSKSWDAAITRICTWVLLKDKATGQNFFVFNTHFDHKGKTARIKSAALITHTIDSLCGNTPVIAMGDFNFKPDDEGYAVMTDTNHAVTLTDAYSTDAPGYTDCGFKVNNTDCSRIDYIFYSKQLSKTNYTLYTDNNGTYYPSDHLAISAVLQLLVVGDNTEQRRK